MGALDHSLYDPAGSSFEDDATTRGVIALDEYELRARALLRQALDEGLVDAADVGFARLVLERAPDALSEMRMNRILRSAQLRRQEIDPARA